MPEYEGAEYEEAEYEGIDALLAAITDEPLPEGARNDTRFMAEHRSAVADVALLREQLRIMGDTLAAQPSTAHPLTAEPLAAQPPTAQPLTAEPLAAQPPTARPPTAEPPASGGPTEAGLDAGLGAGPVSGPEAGPGAGPEAGPGAGPEAGLGARQEAGSDAGPEAGLGAEPEAGSEAGPEAGLGARPVAGKRPRPARGPVPLRPPKEARPRRPRRYRRYAGAAMGALVITAGTALLGGLVWLGAQGGADSGADSKSDSSAAKQEDSGGDTSLFSPEMHLACSKVLVEGTVRSIRPAADGNVRVELRVKRYYRPERTVAEHPTITVTLLESAREDLKIGTYTLVRLPVYPQDRQDWETGPGVADARKELLKALPGARGMQCAGPEDGGSGER